MKTILVTPQRGEQLAVIKKNLEVLFPGGILTARTVEEGLEIARREQPGAAPAIILMDPGQPGAAVETMEKLREQLARQKKIEAISRLAGGIAHAFNNILAIIRGYAELSLDEFREGTTGYRNMRHILTASDRARDLVNQILTFSGQDSGERKPVHINRIAAEALRILRPSLPNTIKIHQEIDIEDSLVMADPTQIRQVLMNLFVNAAQAMQEDGGILEVKLETLETVPGKDMLPGPYHKLTVADTGRGMPREVLERIFDPYFTTRSLGESSGMGLSVTHGIVKKHGGEIVVNSETGKGTTFYLYLPLYRELPPEKAVPGELQSRGGERILLVDDERMLVYMQQEILERLGYEVAAVSSSIEALDIFREDPEIFDLAIIDQNMPGITGIQLSRELLKIRPDIPIILSTNYSETLTRQDALQIGVKEFIMKPIIKREIAGVIRDVLDKEKDNKEKDNIGGGK
jgi:signal transduction histidine kinase/ActR/RegA family two-component response regulator